MNFSILRRLLACFAIILTIVMVKSSSDAATYLKLEKPSPNERWFGIYVGKDLVGYYYHKFTVIDGGFRIDTKGNVKINLMGVTRRADSQETYIVAKDLSLRSFDISHTINGVFSRVYGNKYETSMIINTEVGSKPSRKQIKILDNVFPTPVLNILPLMNNNFIGRTYKVHTFDSEELSIRSIIISVFKEEVAPNGQLGLKMRNTLYPFVPNDIWVDADGNTLWESVKKGLVITRPMDPKLLEGVISRPYVRK